MKTFHLFLILSLAYLTSQTPIYDDIIDPNDDLFGNSIIYSDDSDLSYDDDDLDLSDYITEESLLIAADKPLTDFLGKIFQDLKGIGFNIEDIELVPVSHPNQSENKKDDFIPERIQLLRQNAQELDDKDVDRSSQETPQPSKLQRKNAMTPEEIEEALRSINQLTQEPPQPPKLQRKNAMTPEEIEEALRSINQDDQESEPKIKENSFFNKVIDKVGDLANQDWVDKWVDLIDSIDTEEPLEKPPALLNLDSTVDFEEDVPLKEITQHNMNVSSEKNEPAESFLTASALNNPVQDEMSTVDEMDLVQVNDNSQKPRGYSVYVFTFVIFVLIAIGMKAAKEFRKRENAHHRHHNEESSYVEIATN